MMVLRFEKRTKKRERAVCWCEDQPTTDNCRPAAINPNSTQAHDSQLALVPSGCSETGRNAASLQRLHSPPPPCTGESERRSINSGQATRFQSRANAAAHVVASWRVSPASNLLSVLVIFRDERAAAMQPPACSHRLGA